MSEDSRSEDWEGWVEIEPDVFIRDDAPSWAYGPCQWLDPRALGLVRDGPEPEPEPPERWPRPQPRRPSAKGRAEGPTLFDGMEDAS